MSIYLDYAAASPVRKEVLDAMLPFFSEKFANPSSLHDAGAQVHELVERARGKIMKTLECDSLVFTSSGTESINLALQGVLGGLKKGDHIITTRIEHKAVMETCKYLEDQGVDVTYLKVDSKGFVSASEMKKAITKKTKLISIHYAHNEIGTIQDIVAMGAVAKEHGVLLHVDACQAGFLELSMKKLGVDLMTLNGSKIYGPKGIGVLAIRGSVSLLPSLRGGVQENGVRAGTENVPGIIGFSKALELAQNERYKENERLQKLRDLFVELVFKKIKNVVLNGSKEKRLPSNANISFQGVEGETLLLYLNQHEIYASSGSACTTNEIGVSHVLLGIGLSKASAGSAIRFTFGRNTTKKDIQKVVDVLAKVVESLRQL